ncbi:DUF596 domain-containing protein [Emticicia fontis]
MMIPESKYQEFIENLVQMALGSLWHTTKDYSEIYEERIELFFIILRRLIEEGRIRLAKNGEFLIGTIDDQIELFKNAFPTEKRMREIDSYWWFMDDCPAGSVWIIDREIDGFTTPTGDGKHYYWA